MYVAEKLPVRGARNHGPSSAGALSRKAGPRPGAPRADRWLQTVAGRSMVQVPGTKPVGVRHFVVRGAMMNDEPPPIDEHRATMNDQRRFSIEHRALSDGGPAM